MQPTMSAYPGQQQVFTSHVYTTPGANVTYVTPQQGWFIVFWFGEGFWGGGGCGVLGLAF